MIRERVEIDDSPFLKEAKEIASRKVKGVEFVISKNKLQSAFKKRKREVANKETNAKQQKKK